MGATELLVEPIQPPLGAVVFLERRGIVRDQLRLFLQERVKEAMVGERAIEEADSSQSLGRTEREPSGARNAKYRFIACMKTSARPRVEETHIGRIHPLQSSLGDPAQCHSRDVRNRTDPPDRICRYVSRDRPPAKLVEDRAADASRKPTAHCELLSGCRGDRRVVTTEQPSLGECRCGWSDLGSGARIRDDHPAANGIRRVAPQRINGGGPWSHAQRSRVAQARMCASNS